MSRGLGLANGHELVMGAPRLPIRLSTIWSGWSARQTLPREDMHELSEPVRVALEGALEADERVDLVAPVVGSYLILSDRHLILLREGANFRPATGIRSYALDRTLEVRIAPTTKQVIIESEGRAVSVFIRTEQLLEVEAVVAELRRRIYAE